MPDETTLTIITKDEEAASGGFEGVQTQDVTGNNDLAGDIRGTRIATTISAILQTSDAAVNAFQSVTGALERLEDSLSPFSGDIQGARAQARVREIEATIDRAQKFGPQLAEFTTAKADFGVALEDLKANFFSKLSKHIPEIIEILTTLLELANNFVDRTFEFRDWINQKVADFANGVGDFIQNAFGDVWGLAAFFHEWARLIRLELEEKEKKPLANDFLEKQLRKIREQVLDANAVPGNLPGNLPQFDLQIPRAIGGA